MLQCCLWGRIQLAEARASESDFSHYNPSCLREIKYLITSCITCSVLCSLLEALTVLSRELKSPQIQNHVHAPKIKIFNNLVKALGLQKGKTIQQKKLNYQGQLLARQGGIFTFFSLQATPTLNDIQKHHSFKLQKL